MPPEPDEPRQRIHNRPEQKARRQELRAAMPQAEVILWSRLQRRAFHGLKFRRQHGIGPYILDFYCPELRLAIELDGDSHFQPGAEAQDARRTAYLEAQGVTVLRYTNERVRHELDEVLRSLGDGVAARPTPN